MMRVEDDSYKPSGQFDYNQPENTKTVCGTFNFPLAVTQTNSQPKHFVEVRWKAPLTMTNNTKFYLRYY